MDNQLDHITHGWALLALRIPELRASAKERYRVAEICECYSIAVLHLRDLQNQNSDPGNVAEYQILVSGIEEEVTYYLRYLSRKAG